MDTATSLSIGTVIGGAVVFIARFMPLKNGKNGRVATVSKELCNERHKHIDEQFTRMRADLKEVHTDVRQILDSIRSISERRRDNV